MKKEWKDPELEAMNINQTANSDQEDASPDGVWLGWLDKDGTHCTICS